MIKAGGDFELAEPVEIPDGATIASVRASVAATKAEIALIEKAPCSLDEAKAAARQEIERESAAGRPYVERFMRPGGPALPVFRLAELKNGPALVIWALQDFLLAKVDEELERAYVGRVSFALGPRTVLLDRLRGKLHESELIEEALIVADSRIARRGDASPRAVLRLAL